MCHKCHNIQCCGCNGSGSGSSSNTQNNSETQTNQQIAYLGLPGRPTIMIDDPYDVSCFDEDTGLGSDIWEGWAIANGNSYNDPNKNETVETQNMFNRVPVGAGDQYEIGDQFGVDEVSLTAAQNGQHNHTITDGGHTHTITDSGHTHAVTDEGHSHTVTDPGHTHAVTNTMALSKNIANATHVESDVNCQTGEGADVPDTWQDQTITLTGSVTVNSANTGITIASSAAGITIDSEVTGITVNSASTGISLADSGEGDPHENRQPSSAYLFVKRIYVPN